MNLQMTLEAEKLRTQRQKSRPQKLTALELAERQLRSIEASGHVIGDTPRQWARKYLGSRLFILMDFPLGKAAVVKTPNDQNRILASLGSDMNEPIVIDINKRHMGGAVGGYVPPVIVIEGAHRHQAVKAKGRTLIRAWVGELAAKKLNLAAGVGDNDLRNMLTEALVEKFPNKGKGNKNSSPISDVWIEDIFPSDNYCIMMRQGRKWKQQFKMSGNKATLIGEPKQVRISYVDVQARMGDRMLGNDGMRLEKAMLIYGGATPAAAFSNNPAVEAPGAGGGPRLTQKKGKPISMGKKSKEVKADFSGVPSPNTTTKLQKTKTRGGSKSEMQKRLADVELSDKEDETNGQLKKPSAYGHDALAGAKTDRFKEAFKGFKSRPIRKKGGNQ